MPDYDAHVHALVRHACDEHVRVYTALRRKKAGNARRARILKNAFTAPPSCQFEDLTDAQLAELEPLLKAIEACLPDDTSPTLVDDFAPFVKEYRLTADDIRDQDLEWLVERIEGNLRPLGMYRVEGAENQRQTRLAIMEAIAPGFVKFRKISTTSAERSRRRGEKTRARVHNLMAEIKARDPGIKEDAAIEEISDQLGVERRTVERLKPPR